MGDLNEDYEVLLRENHQLRNMCKFLLNSCVDYNKMPHPVSGRNFYIKLAELGLDNEQPKAEVSQQTDRENQGKN